MGRADGRYFIEGGKLYRKSRLTKSGKVEVTCTVGKFLRKAGATPKGGRA